MPMAEAIVAYHQAKKEEMAILPALREAAATIPDDGDSGLTHVRAQIQAFLDWVDDARPAFADALDQSDKFAELIDISRGYQDCSSFFVSEVGVSPCTVWRWATKKSRPSRYVGQKVAEEVETALQQALWQLLAAHSDFDSLNKLVSSAR